MMSAPMDDLSDETLSQLINYHVQSGKNSMGDQIRRALAELSRRREADRWRPISEACPDLEADDGDLILRWFAPDKARVFSITIRPHSTIGVMSPAVGVPAHWRVDLGYRDLPELPEAT